jgi:hypothetical protein
MWASSSSRRAPKRSTVPVLAAGLLLLEDAVRDRLLDEERAFADVADLERERFAWAEAGVGEDAHEHG